MFLLTAWLKKEKKTFYHFWEYSLSSLILVTVELIHSEVEERSKGLANKRHNPLTPSVMVLLMR